MFDDSSSISKFDFEHSSVIYLHGFGTIRLLRSEHSSVIYLRGLGVLWLLRLESIMQQKRHIIILLNTILRIWVMETPEVGVKNLGDSSPLMQSKEYKDVKSIGASVDQSIDVAGICNEAATLDQEDMVIDEINSGEPWVQGLMEGEYSDLSVEERLSAVVALIGVANEGNSIRIILEECLEAANALKKQMWAKVQLDKCRMKEEYVMKIQYPSYISDKTEPNVQISSVEGRQSPLPTVDDKNNLVSTNPVEQKEHLHDAQNDPNYPIHMPSKRNPQIQEVSTCTDNLSLLQPGYAAERSWSQLKSYFGHKAEEMYVYRSLPLGQDRRRNCYWQFITSSSRNDPGSGRIFFELRHGCWRLIDSEEKDYEKGPGLSAASREDYNIVESMEPMEPDPLAAAVPEDVGTAGALRAIGHHLTAHDILVVSGDLVCDVPPGVVAAAHRRHDAIVTAMLCSARVSGPSESSSAGGKDKAKKPGRYNIIGLDPTQQFLLFIAAGAEVEEDIRVQKSILRVVGQYGMGNEVTTSGDVYSYGILLLEMFTGKKPTDNMFNDSLNLHNFVNMVLPEEVVSIVDRTLVQQREMGKASTSINNTQNQSSADTRKIHECLISILNIGIAYSQELPGDRLTINCVVTQLHVIKNNLLGTDGLHGGRRAKIAA
ncbi:unnamed protein product [Camellia sinensis]